MTDVARRPRPATSDLVLGRYRLEERLGLGGSAEVWRGVDERLGRPVAIKLLHPHLLPDEAARARFEREARAAAALAHPGIVAVFDVEASASRAAIIFELVEGETLADRLAREGALAPTEAARIGAELAEALAHAHERGIVHRDVKPGNVLLERDGRARLVDFGIARLLERESAHLTTAGMITGTLRYLAPEQLAGEEATPSTDLYALGAVLFEMLTGRPAFEASTPVALVEAQRHPPDAIAGVPSGLAAISLSALDPDPAQRPGNAEAMAAELRAWTGRVQIETGIAAVTPIAAVAGSADPTVVVQIPEVADPAAEGGLWWTGTIGPGTVPEEAGWPMGHEPGSRRSRRPRRRPAWVGPLIAVAVVALAVAIAVGSGLPALLGPFGPLPTTGPSAGVVGPSASPGASAPAAATATPAESATPESPGKGKKKGH
jgi:eukaryotic-like serine/threonine-protein kinase